MICKKIDISVDSYQETAALYTYFLDNSPEMIPDRKRPLVLICPGGGYEMTSDRWRFSISQRDIRRRSFVTA